MTETTETTESTETSTPTHRRGPVRRRTGASMHDVVRAGARVPGSVPCRIHTDVDTRYFDRDGDGLLDAVEVIEHLVAEGRDHRRVLSSRRILLAGVDDDGVARTVSVEPAA